MPNNQSYHGPPPPIPPHPSMIHSPFSSSHNQEHIMTGPKTLPLVAHIPLLTGQADFGTWNDGIQTLILHLGYLGHISDPPPSGLNPLPDCVPTHMPVLSATSTADEHTAYRFWWECDNIVSHVLLTCLSAVTCSLLPYDDGDPTSPRCAHLIYNTLCEAYHI